jgi:anti-sigma B factor antagonist
MGAPGDFAVRQETLPGAVVVHVEGELDMATVRELEDAISSSGSAPRLVVDLTACTFVDSAGVRALVSAAGDRPADRELALVATDPGILRVLQITGVDTVIPVHASREAAL